VSPSERIGIADLRALDRDLGAAVRAAVERVAVSGRFVLGETVALFERELAAHLGVRHAVGVGSGSDALLLALVAAGVEPGDVVVTTPLSFIATAEAIVRAGARPRFVDVDPESLCLDPDALARYLDGCSREGEALRDRGSGGRVRAILPVHLYGRLAEVEALDDLATGAGLAMVHDAAHAFGAAGKPLGASGSACLSFFPAKTLGAWGDGGAVVTNDDGIAEGVRMLREHGRSAPQVYQQIGLNSRLDALQAAVLAAKLPHVEAHESARRRHALHYNARLANIEGLEVPRLGDGESVYLYTVRVSAHRRAALREHLSMHGIETAVHYPTLLHEQPALAPYLDGHTPSVPEARRAAAEVLSLPCHPYLDEEAIERVLAAMASFFGQK
jgi:dTDP-4-amino-4,6-dideoxygalactose transaminase